MGSPSAEMTRVAENVASAPKTSEAPKSLGNAAGGAIDTALAGTPANDVLRNVDPLLDRAVNGSDARMPELTNDDKAALATERDEITPPSGADDLAGEKADPSLKIDDATTVDQATADLKPSNNPLDINQRHDQWKDRVAAGMMPGLTTDQIGPFSDATAPFGRPGPGREPYPDPRDTWTGKFNGVPRPEDPMAQKLQDEKVALGLVESPAAIAPATGTENKPEDPAKPAANQNLEAVAAAALVDRLRQGTNYVKPDGTNATADEVAALRQQLQIDSDASRASLQRWQNTDPADMVRRGDIGPDGKPFASAEDAAKYRDSQITRYQSLTSEATSLPPVKPEAPPAASTSIITGEKRVITPDGQQFVLKEGQELKKKADGSYEIVTTANAEREAKKAALNQEQQALIDRRLNGQTLTPQEQARLEQIGTELGDLNKDPRALVESAAQKLREGKTMNDLTPAERAAWNGEDASAAENLTPEQQVEQVKKELEEVGQRLMNGEGSPAENFQKLRELQDRIDGVRTTQQDQEDAKLFAEMYLRDPRENSKRFAKESETQRQVREEIQRLLALEAQLANMPMIIEKKRADKKKVKGEVDRLRDRMDNAYSASDRAARTAEWAPKARELASLRNEIKLMKDADIITRQERRDILRSIDTKLGMNKNWRAVVRWSTDQVANGFDSIHLSINARFDDE